MDFAILIGEIGAACRVDFVILIGEIGGTLWISPFRHPHWQNRCSMQSGFCHPHWRNRWYFVDFAILIGEDGKIHSVCTWLDLHLFRCSYWRNMHLFRFSSWRNMCFAISLRKMLTQNRPGPFTKCFKIDPDWKLISKRNHLRSICLDRLEDGFNIIRIWSSPWCICQHL